VLIKKGFELLPVRKQLATPFLRDYLPRWQNNSSPDDLGVVRFGFDLFPHTLNKNLGVADWVRPALHRVLDWHPEMTKIERAHAICIPRDFSKSTWMGKILPLYFLLVGQYGIYFDYETNGMAGLLPETDYIRLRAKTSEKGEEKLNNVSMEFSNEDVLALFGDLKPSLKEIKDKKLKNTAKLVILRNGYIFQAQGINQPSRGANIQDRRPKLDINDDVENQENTKTPSSRTYNQKEILGEQFGGLHKQGLTIYIGNYVHKECIMAHLVKKNSGWKSMFFQATYIDERGKERSLWEKNFSVEYIHELGEWYRNQEELGGYKIFRMEYYNEIISDKEYQIQFIETEYIREKGDNYIMLKEPIVEEGKPKIKTTLLKVFIVVSGDPAISKEKKACDGAMTVTAFASDGNRYILDCSVAKFDLNDRYEDVNFIPKNGCLAMGEELENVKRKGLVSEMARYILRYNADGFVLENAGQQLAWFNELCDVLERLKVLNQMQKLPYRPKDEKDYKLETGLLNYWSYGKYFISETCGFKGMVTAQVSTFPENRKDILDCLHNAEQLKQFPSDPVLKLGKIAPSEINPNDTYSPPDEVEAWVIL
jgi:hypothetical protein